MSNVLEVGRQAAVAEGYRQARDSLETARESGDPNEIQSASEQLVQAMLGVRFIELVHGPLDRQTATVAEVVDA